MKKTISHLVFMVFVSLMSCVKTDEPGAKEEGTFEVSIEGAVSQTLHMEGSCTNVFALYYDISNMGVANSKYLQIQGNDDQNRTIAITLYFDNLPLDGKFNLGLDDNDLTYSGFGQYIPDINNGLSLSYITDDVRKGTCIITEYDQANQTISGEFDFTGQGYNSGAVLAGVEVHCVGTFSNIPINDLTDPNNPKGVCFGTTGNPLGSGGAGGGNGGGGGGGTGGGSNTSTITFINPAYTPVNIEFNGESKTIPVGSSVTYTGTANGSGSGTASTSGKTTSGTQVGLLLTWSINQPFPAAGQNLNYTLTVTSQYFFLKMKNNSSQTITRVYVNKGLLNETLDNITLSPNSNTYNLGYYKAFTNSNVRAENDNYNWYWSSLNLTFVNNQSVTVIAN